MDMEKTVIVALAGKGGVGKTSLAAVIVKSLVEQHPGKKILAIDADPAVGLSVALGITVNTTIDDVRKEAVKAAGEGKNAVVEVLGNAEYSIEEAIVEGPGFSFIAIGRPEAAGCYCRINDYLKDVIAAIASYYDFIVIDGEAGVEQINRRVMEKVTHLILVSDQSKKGRQVVETIKSVADELVMYEKIGVIANRLSPEAMDAPLDFGSVPLLAKIPMDNQLADYDLKGENVFYLPDSSPICVGAKEALAKLGI
jgi:CO dehydrogenase maturation factor